MILLDLAIFILLLGLAIDVGAIRKRLEQKAEDRPNDKA